MGLHNVPQSELLRAIYVPPPHISDMISDYGADYSMDRKFIVKIPENRAGELFESDLTKYKNMTPKEWQPWLEDKLQNVFRPYNNIQLGAIEDFSDLEGHLLPDEWHMMITETLLAPDNRVLMMLEVYTGPVRPKTDRSNLYPKIDL